MITFVDYSAAKAGKTFKLPADIAGIVLTYLDFDDTLVFLCSANGIDYGKRREKYITDTSDFSSIERHFEVEMMESFLRIPKNVFSNFSDLLSYKQLEEILICSARVGLTNVFEYILYNFPFKYEKFLGDIRIKHIIGQTSNDDIKKIIDGYRKIKKARRICNVNRRHPLGEIVRLPSKR